MTSSNDKTFTVTVDGEPVEIPRKGATPSGILEAADLNPAERYLIEKTGNNTESYKDRPDVEIKIHENQVFLTGRLGAVGVA